MYSLSFLRFVVFVLVQLFFYPHEVVSAVYTMTTWLGGWLDVTRQYCIKTVKPILKLFQPAGSPMILVSSDPCTNNQLNGNPFSGGYIYTGVGKFHDFRWKSPFISETVRDRPMVTM